MSLTKLPIGIQEFEHIISNGYTYVDKTELIYRLITQGKPYFLSRPRRFGKSLLVSTLYALFSGRRDLFAGLWIDKSDWDWRPSPVIRLDMGQMNNQNPELLEKSLINYLKKIATKHQIALEGETSSDYFSDLIEQLSIKEEVVVLIDEYDKPILDQIDQIEIAIANQNLLRQFYSVLKYQDRYLKFAFLTGITKFAKVSVFSGLNNLNDLTMSNDYSALLGYTSAELRRYFSENIAEVAFENDFSNDECYMRIKEWYNGYQFSEKGESVYNPFSTLRLLSLKRFSSHWFETGTPTFLINLIKKRQFDLSNMEDINVAEESFTSFNIEDLPTLALLYQTGYLTIKESLRHINAFRLGFPNREVAQAFSGSLLSSFATSKADCNKYLIDLSENLYVNPWNFEDFFQILQKLLALIPYDLYVKQEKHYHSLCYLIIRLAGFHINAEVHTQRGKLDASLETTNKIIIFEFKLNQSSQIALDQINKKKYHELYQDRNLPIYLVGINFNGEQRIIDDWQVEMITY